MNSRLWFVGVVILACSVLVFRLIVVEPITSDGNVNLLHLYHDGTSDASSPKGRVQLIFVHGLHGHRKSTFEYDVDKSMWWPPTFPHTEPLPLGPRVKAIHTFGYTMSPDDNSIGGLLLPYLQTHCTPDVPCILVGHSKGGLVIKEAVLQLADATSPQKAKQIIEGAIFLGTPHFGSFYDVFNWLNLGIGSKSRAKADELFGKLGLCNFCLDESSLPRESNYVVGGVVFAMLLFTAIWYLYDLHLVYLFLAVLVASPFCFPGPVVSNPSVATPHSCNCGSAPMLLTSPLPSSDDHFGIAKPSPTKLDTFNHVQQFIYDRDCVHPPVPTWMAWSACVCNGGQTGFRSRTKAVEWKHEKTLAGSHGVAAPKCPYSSTLAEHAECACSNTSDNASNPAKPDCRNDCLLLPEDIVKSEQLPLAMAGSTGKEMCVLANTGANGLQFPEYSMHVFGFLKKENLELEDVHKWGLVKSSQLNWTSAFQLDAKFCPRAYKDPSNQPVWKENYCSDVVVLVVSVPSSTDGLATPTELGRCQRPRQPSDRPTTCSLQIPQRWRVDGIQLDVRAFGIGLLDLTVLSK